MYFDPGTGSLIIQIFLSLVAGISAFLCIQRNKIKEFFNKKKSKEKKDEK